MIADQTITTLNSNVSENNCVVCYQNVEIYAIGVCNHPICYECSTRLRILCKNIECPMCRQRMPNVYFSKSIKTYEELVKKCKNENLSDDVHGIYYLTTLIKGRVDFLFTRKCNICKGVAWNFKTNEKLEQHLKREHGLSHCRVCVKHLKLFTFERKCYTESELDRHNREGDPDDTSYRGHSLCQFCSKYFFDKDELYIHLRRDHFRCHLCNESSGKQPFYSTRAHLYDHFKKDHYLCNKEECKTEQLVSVFETKAEYKIHLQTVHENRVDAANEERKSKQPSQTVSRREHDEQSRSTTNSVSSSPESVLEELPKRSASEAYPVLPHLSQQSRDNFSRQFGSSSIPIGTPAQSKRRNNKVQPNAAANQIVSSNHQAGIAGPSSGRKQTKQVYCSQAFPPLKPSQNSMDDFFNKIESKPVHQPSSSAGRIKKALMESKGAPSTKIQLQKSNASKSYKLPQLSQKSRETYFSQNESSQPVPEVAVAPTNFSIGGLPFLCKGKKVEPKNGPKTAISDETGLTSTSSTKPKKDEPKRKHFQRPQLSQSTRDSYLQQFAGVAPVQPVSEPTAQNSVRKDSDVGTTKGKGKKVKWTKLQ